MTNPEDWHYLWKFVPTGSIEPNSESAITAAQLRELHDIRYQVEKEMPQQKIGLADGQFDSSPYDWKLVRRVKAGNSWHPSSDHVRGTDVYGTPCGATDDCTFSVAFDHESFDEFMFATGDGANWLIADKEEVYASSANTLRMIESSSTSCLPYEARWYNRSGNSEDPWLSLTDHHHAIGAGDILYGARSYGGGHA